MLPTGTWKRSNKLVPAARTVKISAKADAHSWKNENLCFVAAEQKQFLHQGLKHRESENEDQTSERNTHEIALEPRRYYKTQLRYLSVTPPDAVLARPLSLPSYPVATGRPLPGHQRPRARKADKRG